MTSQARLVLDDCRKALAELTDGLQGSDWRRRWVAAIALLRSVGYVLKEVDRQSSVAMAQAVDAEWAALKRDKAKPEHAVFFEFIEDERNGVLHAYRFRAGQNVTVNLNSAPPRGTVSYSMNSGPFAGQDPRELIRHGIDWWERYLDRVENRADAERAEVVGGNRR
jgi:hypothetical protein